MPVKLIIAEAERNRAARVPDTDHERRKRTRDHRTCSDDASLTHMYLFQDCHIGAAPDVCAEHDLSLIYPLVNLLHLSTDDPEVVISTYDHDPRSDRHTVLETKSGATHHADHRTVADEHIIADMNVSCLGDSILRIESNASPTLCKLRTNQPVRDPSTKRMRRIEQPQQTPQ